MLLIGELDIVQQLRLPQSEIASRMATDSTKTLFPIQFELVFPFAFYTYLPMRDLDVVRPI